MKRQFDGTREIGSTLRYFSGQQVYDQVVEDTTPKVDPESTVLGKQKQSAKAKSADNKRWKKMSILWKLPYCKDIVVHHSIDLMHVKKDVYGSLLGTLMNDKWKTKDHAKARVDLEELDIRPKLRPDGTSAQPPLSAINLTQEEK